MVSKIAIEGLGLVGAFGTGVEAFSAALQAGNSDPQMLPVDPDGDECLCPALRATDLDGLKEYVNLRALRRIDYFSRLAILGVGTALTNANMMEADRSKMGIVIGTGYGATATTFGFMDSMLDFGDACASPTKFSNSVHNAAAANVAIALKIKGVNLTVSQFDMSVPMALHASLEWLQSGAADTIICGGVDEYCRPLGYCYKRFFGEQTGPMNPKDFNLQSAIPGEGAGFMVLRRLEDAQQPMAVIDNIQLGYGKVDPPPAGELIIGADGHVQSGTHYAESLGEATNAISYTPVYGSMPCGPIFDMAAGVIQLGQSTDSVHCLKYDCRGDYALVSMSREGIK